VDHVRHHRFSLLFVETGAALKRYVRRLVRSREMADDIVQETFLRAYEHADGDRPPAALLYSIARNLAIDHYRRERRTQAETILSASPAPFVSGVGGDSLESWLLAEERSALLKDAIERLPPQCRAAFALRVFHCCSYKEIAEKLAISEKTVESHISRGARDTYRYLHRRYQLKDGESHHG
jgi:RNA polymerase sigma factor (sigma-70 family)